MMTVIISEMLMPPRTARASGAYGFAALAQLQRHRQEADDGGERSHQDGTQADARRGDYRLAHAHAVLAQVAGEFDDQDAIGDGHADQDHETHERHYVHAGAGDIQNQQRAGQSRRNGRENQQRIEERAKLRDQDEIEQHDGQREPDAEAMEALAHALYQTAEGDRDARGHLCVGGKIVNCAGNAAEVFAEGLHVDIDYAPQLVVIHFGGRLDARDARDGVEASGISHARAAYRNGAQVVEITDLGFRILHGQHVVVAGLGIDPETGRDHGVGSERGDDVADHFLLREAEFGGAGAVDVKLQSRVVDILRHVDVADAGNPANLAGQVGGERISGFEIRSGDLHVDGRRHAEAEHGVHQSAGLEVSRYLRHLLRDAARTRAMYS